MLLKQSELTQMFHAVLSPLYTTLFNIPHPRGDIDLVVRYVVEIHKNVSTNLIGSVQTGPQLVVNKARPHGI